MDGNEVIVAGTSCAPFSRTLRRLRAKTLNCRDVVLSVLLGQTGPREWSAKAIYHVARGAFRGSVHVPIFADSRVPRGTTTIASLGMGAVDPLLGSGLELLEGFYRAHIWINAQGVEVALASQDTIALSWSRKDMANRSGHTQEARETHGCTVCRVSVWKLTGLPRGARDRPMAETARKYLKELKERSWWAPRARSK